MGPGSEREAVSTAEKAPGESGSLHPGTTQKPDHRLLTAALMVTRALASGERDGLAFGHSCQGGPPPSPLEHPGRKHGQPAPWVTTVDAAPLNPQGGQWCLSPQGQVAWGLPRAVSGGGQHH